MQGLRAARAVCPECEHAAEEALKMEPYHRKRLYCLEQERDRLRKRKREHDLAVNMSRQRMCDQANEVQQEIRRLERIQSRDTGANSVALNTMRQLVRAARSKLDDAEKCLGKEQRTNVGFSCPCPATANCRAHGCQKSHLRNST